MNILDVAAAAGVSSATVSRVLNGGNVSADTKTKVEAAIRKLNYFPNNLARTLITGKSMNIGVLTHSLTNSFSTEFVEAVSLRLAELDYRLFVTSSGVSGTVRDDLEAKYLSSFLSQKVDGIILHDPSTHNYESGFYAEVAKQVPFVMVHSFPHVTDINSVLIDQVLGMQKAMEHLLALGHRRIWMVRSSGYSQDLKEEVWRAALTAAGVEVDDESVINSPFGDTEAGISLAFEWMTKRLEKGDRPTAVFASNDIQGVGVKSALEKAGLRIPEDVSLIAHDNTILAEIGGFTSVDMKRAAAGHATVDLLMSCIRGRDKEVRRVYLTPDLVHRGSTRALVV